MPRASVTSTPTPSANDVRPPGMDTVGVDSPGSDCHISTIIRRYGKARIMLVTTPTTASHDDDEPPNAAWNTANLDVKPDVSGIPANASIRNVKTPANSGDRRP